MTDAAGAAPSPLAASAAALAMRARFRRLFAAVMVPMFLAAVDQTLLATATPVISREMGGLQDSAWLAVSYLLASVVMVPLYGQMGDHFGRRRVLCVAIAMFSIGSLGCGLAASFGLLVAARVLQGLGGGGLMTLSQALIGEVVPPHRRARNQGYFAIVFMIASVGGPVIGGLVVHHASWRWLFLVNVPLCLYALWRLWSLRGDDTAHPHAGRFDAPGLVLFAVAIGTSLFWLSAGGHRFDWLSAASVAMVAVAFAAWTALVVVERRSVRPFLPVALLKLAPVRAAVFTVLGFAATMFAMVFYLPVYLQLALGSNAAEAGMLLLPLTGGILCGSVFTGRLIVWTGRPTAIPIGGLLLAGVSLAALAVAPADKRLLVALGSTCGLGLGSVMSVMQIVTQTAAGPQRLGAAAATMALARTLGSSVGASAFGALIFGVVGEAPASIEGAALVHSMSHQLHEAFRAAFMAAAGLCAVSAFMASRVPALRFDAEISRQDAIIGRNTSMGTE